MDIKSKEEIGSLNISEAVIEKIAKLVVDEIDGVYSMAPIKAKFKENLFRSEKEKSIRLVFREDAIQIDIYVLLKAGFRIKEVAESIQEYVKDAVQNMTSITVSKVNVYVRGISNDNE